MKERVSIYKEHVSPMHVGLELEIYTVGPCGSDEWQIDMSSEPPLTDPFEHLRVQ